MWIGRNRERLEQSMLKRKLHQIKNVKQVILTDAMQTDQELCNDWKKYWRMVMMMTMMKIILASFQQQAIQVASEVMIQSNINDAA